jgi:hypothetical protein
MAGIRTSDNACPAAALPGIDGRRHVPYLFSVRNMFFLRRWVVSVFMALCPNLGAQVS